MYRSRATTHTFRPLHVKVTDDEIKLYASQGVPSVDRLIAMHFKRGPGGRNEREKYWKITIAFLVPNLLLLGIPAWFIFPPPEKPVSSDAIIVMAGAFDGRHEFGAQMIDDGYSSYFVVSTPLGDQDKIGTAHCRGESKPINAVKVWCMRPIPETTAGEALTVGQLAKVEGWTSITAVTNRPHARRVRTTLEQCTDLHIRVVPTDKLDFTRIPVQIAREIAGYIKFWTKNPC